MGNRDEGVQISVEQIFGYSNIFENSLTNIFMHQNICIILWQIYLDSHLLNFFEFQHYEYSNMSKYL